MTSLGPGDKMPSFELLDDSQTLISSESMLGKGPIVIYFYPKDNTPICTKESCAFRDTHGDFASAGAAVYGISVDDASSHKSFRDAFQLPFSLLADTDNKVRKLFGVPKALGLMPGRSTYVIDQEGIIRHVTHSSFRAQKHVDEALTVVRDLANAS